MNYEIAPSLFLEFHGSEQNVEDQAKAVGKLADTLIMKINSSLPWGEFFVHDVKEMCESCNILDCVISNG